MWERADGPDDWRVCVWVGKQVGGVGGGGGGSIRYSATFVSLSFTRRAVALSEGC